MKTIQAKTPIHPKLPFISVALKELATSISEARN